MFEFRRSALALLILLTVSSFALPATSQAVEPPLPAQAELDVPQPLRPWVDWVMYDRPDLDCPQVDGTGGGRLCVWPGTLEVRADDDGATFEMNVWLARRGDVRLPGDNTHWPQAVTADARSTVVKDAGGFPSVALDAGAHRIAGRFDWTSVPEVLAAPTDIGRVRLQVGGDDVERPQLDANGRLWMQSAGASSPKDEADSIRTSVYRRLEDGSPLRIITQLELNVSGKAREIDMGRVLVAKSRPVSIESQLPVKVDREGRVSVYARPGTHQVTVQAVLRQKSEQIAVPEPGADFYDPQEVWVWVPDEVVRSVELSGLQTVDPARTSLPEAWRGHTTFLAEPKQTLKLDVTRRGVSPSPNVVRLERQLWLDVDGEGYTIRDRLTGTLHKDWRLDYAGQATLGNVHNAGAGDDVLITRNPAKAQGHSGVELRESNLDMTADLRLDEPSGELRAVGWNHDVQQLSAYLNLPPGWTLFATGGVDEVDGTWLDSWTLWDFFFVLMVALSIGKLLGWRWTPLAIAALVLSHGHSGAPMWVWLHLVVAIALLRVLPDGWWRKGAHAYRLVTLLVLFGVLANFSHDQIRAGLHPEVDRRAFKAGDDDFSFGAADQTFATAEAPVQFEPAQSADEDRFAELAQEVDEAAPRKKGKFGANRYAKEKSNWLGSMSSGSKLDLQQVDPKAVVQTGPGLPTWTWNSWRLQWSGPVHKDHTIDLWLISPTLNRALAFVRVALLIVLALLLMIDPSKTGRPESEGGDEDASDTAAKWWRQLVRAGVVLLAGGFALGVSGEASAEEPIQQQVQQSANIAAPVNNVAATAGLDHDDMLRTLRKRLTKARQCDGVCVVVSRADITVDGLAFEMRADVHAQKESGWHLPGPADAVLLDSITVDGLRTDQLRREPGGLTAVRLPQGRHTVVMRGKLANRNVVTVQFHAATRPKRVTFASDDWTVDGISPQGVPDNSLQLTRRQQTGNATTQGVGQAPELPPWYNVHRTVGLGLPWKVQTTVTRPNAERPQLVKVPLIDGENVITDGLRVEDGMVLVDFPRGESTVGYVSELPIREKVEVVAPKDKPWSESWTVECSRIWRCSFSELPPVQLLGDDGVFRPTWKPWPGEKLSVGVERPAGAEGQSSTVEHVSYTVEPGKRLLVGTLTMTIRASQGGWQTVTLPEGAELQSTAVDAADRSLRLEEGKLDLPVRPGKHDYVVKWQQPWERSFIERMPQVDIGSEAANVELRIERGEDRWLLRTIGPQWGPAVMFWSHLVILLIIAVLLGQLRGLPLKTWEWMLLVIGMSQLPYVALIPVVGWFAALTLRQSQMPEKWWKFDLVQLVLVGMTIAAAATLYAAVHTNLLFDVDMQVAGAQSYDSLLRWYVDRSGSELATPAIVSLPLLVWRVLMLAWAFWLVSRLLSWVPWGWQAFSEGGLWRGRRNADSDSSEDSEEPKASE